MAIEFGSRKETFDNFKVYETMLAGRPFKVEMGKMCGLSNASALIRYGETCVMCNVVMSPKPREGVDFFPLNVEYEEKLYAAVPGVCTVQIIAYAVPERTLRCGGSDGHGRGAGFQLGA